MKQRIFRFALLTAMLVLPGLFPAAAPAYFDRGPVTVDVGQSSVTVKEGESMTVSVKVTPDSDSQLPGCGMAECPQTCGDKNCLNDEGECMCNGLEYKTYVADVKTATSDAGIATASYNSGGGAVYHIHLEHKICRPMIPCRPSLFGSWMASIL
jgi:hypothetical protein